MKQATKKRMLTTLIVAMVCLSVIAGIIVVNVYIQAETADSVDRTLAEIMQQQSFNFSSKLTDESVHIKGLAGAASFNGRDNTLSQELLDNMSQNSNFDVLLFADANGDALSSQGKTYSFSGWQIFERSLAGETIVSEPILTDDGNQVISVSTPVKNGGTTVGVLVGIFSANKLNELFLSSFDGKGYAYVTNGNGDIIAETRNDYSLTTSDTNIMTDWEKASFMYGSNIDKIKQDIQNNQSGSASYELYGQKRLAHYSPIGISDWFIFSIVPDDVISVSADRISKMTLVATLSLALIFILLMFWFFKLQKKHLLEIEEVVFTDELTGVPTMSKFQMEVKRLLEENPSKTYMLVKMDIDRFKLINQTFGYSEGNTILKNMASAIGQSLSEDVETFARINGDEFIILALSQTGVSDNDLFSRFQRRFNTLMGDFFDYDIKFHMGRYHIEKSDENSIPEAIEKVNAAHRLAKQNGMEVCDFHESIIEDALERKKIENMMESALMNGEFKLYIQPKYGLASRDIEGAEALVRWQTDSNDIIYPNKFISIFEDNGFITKLDMYMYYKVCFLLGKWLKEGKHCVPISVNFSRLHLSDPAFVEKLCKTADKHGVPHHLVEIELTETAIFENEALFSSVIDELHKAGFTLSMDDFGTGYSSLGLLKNIPIDIIKIDRSFFVNSSDEARSKTVLNSVISMARELGIGTVAEGVEIEEHIDLLTELGCDIVQGYYFAKPMPEDDFDKKLHGE